MTSHFSSDVIGAAKLASAASESSAHVLASPIDSPSLATTAVFESVFSFEIIA